MSRDPSPEIVAQSFVKQYYEVLTNNPSDLYRFYKADSFFTYCQGHQTEEPLIGAEQLKNKASSFNFKGTRINLSEGSIDAQKSGTGVLLVVTGEFTLPGANPKAFIQTFFLAGEQTTLTFYVRNSVLRLLGDLTGLNADGNASIMQPKNKNQLHTSETQTGLASEEADQIHVPVSEATVEVAEKVEPVSAEPAVVEAAAAEIDSPEVDDENVDDNDEDEVEPNGGDNADDAVEEEEEAVAEAPPAADAVASAPKTYADMAKSKLAGVGAPAPSPAIAAAAPGRAGRRSPTVVAPRTAAAPESPPTPAGDSSATPKGKAEFAIYVSKIPDSTSGEELTALFSPFGKVVKTELIPGKGYAFVSVDSEASLQAVLAHSSPFEIRGAVLNVEEKNSKAGGGGRRGERSGRSRSGGGSGGERGSGGASGSTRSGRGREGGRERGDKEKEKGGAERGDRGDRGERGGDRDRNRSSRNGDSGGGKGGGSRPATGGSGGAPPAKK